MRIELQKRAAVAAAFAVGSILSGCGPVELDALEGDQPLQERWLTHCERDRDCPALGQCVHGLCTMRCDASTLDTCASLSSEAVCDTNLGACDVPCGVAMACQVLGSGYACAPQKEADRCRAAASE